MNPLTAPFEFSAQIGSRVMRDLDAMSEVARAVPKAIALLESLDRRAVQMLELGERIDARAEAILTLGASLEHRAETIITLGGTIDERGAELVALGGQFTEVGEKMLTEARLVHQRAAEVVAQANEVVAVLPTVRRAIEIGEPLEGAIERFARVVDRLPGATGSRPRQD